MSVFDGQSYKNKCTAVFYADHLDLYFSILLFLAIGYDKGCYDDKATFLTSRGVLQSYLLCRTSDSKSDIVFDGIWREASSKSHTSDTFPIYNSPKTFYWLGYQYNGLLLTWIKSSSVSSAFLKVLIGILETLYRCEI